MGKDGLSFAEAIEEAQRVPNAPSDGAAADVSSPFPGMTLPADHRVIDTNDPNAEKIRGAVEYDYEAAVDIFCLNKDEDRERYVGVLNSILSGKALKQYEEKTWSKEGDFMVALCYLRKLPMKRKPNPLGLPKHEEDEDDNN